MGSSLYRLVFERVTDLCNGEVDAILDYSQLVGDSSEWFLAVDFEDDDPDMKEIVEDLKSRVRPEVFDALKKMSLDCESYVIA
jgi:hypothetical protein